QHELRGAALGRRDHGDTKDERGEHLRRVYAAPARAHPAARAILRVSAGVAERSRAAGPSQRTGAPPEGAGEVTDARKISISRRRRMIVCVARAAGGPDARRIPRERRSRARPRLAASAVGASAAGKTQRPAREPALRLSSRARPSRSTIAVATL